MVVPVLCSPSTGQALILPRVNTSKPRVKCLLGYDPVDKQFKVLSMTQPLDGRSEKFRLIQVHQGALRTAMLGFMVNFNGKLGFIMPKNPGGNIGLISGKTAGFKLWVLEDVETQELSERIYELPPQWKNVVGEHKLDFVGLSRTHEIVLSSWQSINPFYLFYFNPERNTVVRVQIQGVDMDGSRFALLQTFLDHVEDVKLYPKVH
ncbi:F-box protein [Raphanus sativus]|nr:F-box protein [Raphanus sativus]